MGVSGQPRKQCFPSQHTVCNNSKHRAGANHVTKGLPDTNKRGEVIDGESEEVRAAQKAVHRHKKEVCVWCQTEGDNVAGWVMGAGGAA